MNISLYFICSTKQEYNRDIIQRIYIYIYIYKRKYSSSDWKWLLLSIQEQIFLHFLIPLVLIFANKDFELKWHFVETFSG